MAADTIRRLFFTPTVAIARLGASSIACLIAGLATTVDDMTRRRNEAITRHFRHLAEMAVTCRYAEAPCWSEYLAWIRRATTVGSSEPTVAAARTHRIWR